MGDLNTVGHSVGDLNTVGHSVGDIDTVRVRHSIAYSDTMGHSMGNTDTAGHCAEIENSGILRWEHWYSGTLWGTLIQWDTLSVTLQYTGPLETVPKTGGHVGHCQ